MKKLLIAAAAAASLQCFAASPGEFLNDFGDFVTFVTTDSTMTPALRQRADSIYRTYDRDYNEIYRKDMTPEQRDEYFRYKGQYTQYRITRKAVTITDKADSISGTVTSKINEGISFLRGLLGK